VPGKRYLFRIINMSGFASNIIKFQGHNMTIVEMDGVATVPVNASKIQIAAAQRYNVIITALPTAATNFGILSAMMPDMFLGDSMPADSNMNVSSWLRGE
jgi:iron transport multicopper oxidase